MSPGGTSYSVGHIRKTGLNQCTVKAMTTVNVKSHAQEIQKFTNRNYEQNHKKGKLKSPSGVSCGHDFHR
jgi:hypothetical protein